MTLREDCGAKFVVRIPDAPADQWETDQCIQQHDQLPAPAGVIHDSGDGTRWVQVDGFSPTVTIITLVDERDTLKDLRETMSAAQSGLVSFLGANREIPHIERLQRIIDEIDRQRPLGPDGKHGDLHTDTCQCEED